MLDEPEAALSPKRQLQFLTILHDYCKRGSQFIIATHSPIIMAYPDSSIYRFGTDGISPGALHRDGTLPGDARLSEQHEADARGLAH